MSESVLHNLLIRKEFSLFEEFSDAVRGWELDFCQLSRSHAPFYLEQIQGSAALISRAYFPTAFHQLGGATPGCRTVSIMAPRSQAAGWRWCGESVTHNSLVVMPVGGEFESVSAPDFDSIHLALPISLLEDVAEADFQLPLHQLMPDDRCFCPQGGEPLALLRALLLAVTREPGGNGSNGRQRLRPSLEREMAYLVLACLARGGVKAPLQPRGKRMRTLANALEVIAAEPLGTLNVGQLVARLGVSRRTLENAFSDALDVSPAAYLKALRLHGINRELLGADVSTTSVAELANAHGFRHLGQFAADYRDMFGELPSATLRRPAA